MNYKEWIKMFPKSMKINWSEPLTEEEKNKLSSQLPEISEFWMQEQKELCLLKKMADKYERQASAKDSEISKERLRMRLRKKLANKKDAKGKGKDGHICSKDCEKRQRKRARKMAAKKNIYVPKSKDSEQLSEEQQKNLEGEKSDNLYQYRDPDKSYDDDEKEDSQNDEDEVDNDSDDDGQELNSDVYKQPQDFPSPYKNSYLSEKNQQHIMKMQEKMDHYGNAYEKYLNSYHPNLDNDAEEDNKTDENDEDAVKGLHMKALEMSEGPQQYHGEEVLSGEEEDSARFLSQPQEEASASSSSTEHEFSNDFSKFLNYKYHF